MQGTACRRAPVAGDYQNIEAWPLQVLSRVANCQCMHCVLEDSMINTQSPSKPLAPSHILDALADLPWPRLRWESNEWQPAQL